MSNFLELEHHAERTRHYLTIASTPELRLLCLLDFCGKFSGAPSIALEPYLREFIEPCIHAAADCSVTEFLPEDADSIATLLARLKIEFGHIVSREQIDILDNLRTAIRQRQFALPELAGLSGRSQREVACAVACLFVEDYPELGLPSRGRLLTLYAKAERRPTSETEDQIVLTNPGHAADEQFIQQAARSLAVARTLFKNKYGLPNKYRYRLDVTINHRGARFTGDSLGAAIGAVAFAAIVHCEVLRQRLRLSASVALTGALGEDGSLKAVDTPALLSKIRRAFYSTIRYVVIPREHLVAAWEYLKSLEREFPNRLSGSLELVGVDHLNGVVEDPRIATNETLSFPTFLGHKVRQKARSPVVEIPILMVLLAIAWFLFGYAFWRDHNPTFAKVEGKVISVLSADSLHLYDISLARPFPKIKEDSANYRFRDLNGDGKNEFIFIPPFAQPGPGADTLLVYAHDGTLLFSRDCRIPGGYFGDSVDAFYESPAVWTTAVSGKPMIITEVFQHIPARQHQKFWDASGNELGWYVNAGGAKFQMARDIDGDTIEELIFCAFNNRMGCSAVYAIKPYGSVGVSPPYVDPQCDLSQVTHGNQVRYLILPTTDLGMVVLPNPYNSFQKLEYLGSGEYRTRTLEGFNEQIFYYLDSSFRVTRCTANDQFVQTHFKLFEAPNAVRARHSLDGCLANIVNSVSYWIDGRWVTEGELRARAR
jgi:hypothetical protein